MARKLGKLASRRGQTAKIGLSDGCWKIWLPLGCHDGTISMDLEAIWGMSAYRASGGKKCRYGLFPRRRSGYYAVEVG